MVTFSPSARSVPTRLAIRIASTTPWQYPLGVMRTTSISSSSLRRVSGWTGRRAVEMEGGRLAPRSAGEQEPAVEQDADGAPDGELRRRGERGGRHKRLEDAGDDEE